MAKRKTVVTEMVEARLKTIRFLQEDAEKRIANLEEQKVKDIEKIDKRIEKARADLQVYIDEATDLELALEALDSIAEEATPEQGEAPITPPEEPPGGKL